PIRHPYILTSPQVAPGYFKGLAFFSCGPLRPPLPSSGYIDSNLDRALGRSCAPGTSFPPPSYEAFAMRVATPMAATSTCRLPTAAKAGSSSISVMAASATWGCPGGEAPEQVGARVDRVIARSRVVDGDIALFAHGHVLRVLVAGWIGLPASGGQHF